MAKRQKSTVNTVRSIDVKVTKERRLIVTYQTYDGDPKKVGVRLARSVNVRQNLHNLLIDNDDRYYTVVDIYDVNDKGERID